MFKIIRKNNNFEFRIKKKSFKIKKYLFFIKNVSKNNIFKLNVLLLIIIIIIIYSNNIINYNIKLKNCYLKIQKNIQLIFQNKIKNKIRIGIYLYQLNGGGTTRTTSLFIKFFIKIKIFDIYLYTQEIKEEEKAIIPDNIKRVFIKSYKMNCLIRGIKKKKLDIFIYQFPIAYDIKFLNNIEFFKTIFYQHSSLFYFLNYNISIMKLIYKEYINSKYIINLIPVENDYIFKKWRINSILMKNFITYDFKYISPSDLSSKIILMVGRANDKFKRFELGIRAMEYIINEINDCYMKIISSNNETAFLHDLSLNINIKDNIEIINFTLKPEQYYKNASLHIFPSISESFGMVLIETKIFGIPNILLGLDYIILSEGGTIIIYDENPEAIAIESLKILKNENLRKKLGNEARLSIRKINNKSILKKWIKLILSVYNGDIYYQKLVNKDSHDKHLFSSIALKILNNQLNLFKKRKSNFQNLTVNVFLNYTFLNTTNT